jgi:hypothetical protein
MNTRSLYNFIIVSLLVLSGGGIPFIFFRKPLLFLLLFLLMLGVIVQKRKLTVQMFRAHIVVFLLFSSFFVLNYLLAPFPQSFQKVNGMLVISGIAAFSVLFFRDRTTDFLNSLYSVLTVILYHSLLGFALYTFIALALIDVSNQYYEFKSLAYVFYYIPNLYEYNFFGINICRSQGLFWEPGVLQIYLNILLFLEMFVLKKSRLVMWMTVIAILTTYSSTGVAVLCIQLLIYFTYILRKNILLLPLISLGVFGMYQVTKTNIEEKVQGEKVFSFQKRLFDLLQPVYITYCNPILGVGFDDQQYKITRSSPEYSLILDQVNFENTEEGTSNSVMFLFAGGGLPLAIFFLLCLYRQTFVLEKRKWFFVFIIISLMTEPLFFRPIFMMLVFSGAIKILSTIKWKTY